MEKFSIGIDVDKKELKVCLLFREANLEQKVKGNKVFLNSKEGFESLVEWVDKKSDTAIESCYVLETTGVYHEQLAYFLHRKGKNVHVVLPIKAKRYIQSLGYRSKTDKIDAKGLARMGAEQLLEKWQPNSPNLLKLRSITRQIETLKHHKTMFNNQLEGIKHAAFAEKIVEKSILTMIKQLEKQIAQLEEKVKSIIEKDALLKHKYSLVKPLKGVGLMTFAVVVAETNGFALFKSQKQLVSYAGYDIIQNQSGQRVGKTKISKKGNSHIRRILHMPALVAVRHQVPELKQLFSRVYERRKIKMKGYVAVQRKLLIVIYTLWKNDTPYNPNYRKSENLESKPLFSVAPAGA